MPAAWEVVAMGKQRSKLNYHRRVLRLPDLDHYKVAVLNSLGSPASRRVYEYAIDQFIAWNPDSPSIASSLCATACTWNHAVWLQTAEAQCLPEPRAQPVRAGSSVKHASRERLLVTITSFNKSNTVEFRNFLSNSGCRFHSCPHWLQ
jgi:hypothetical protein